MNLQCALCLEVHAYCGIIKSSKLTYMAQRSSFLRCEHMTCPAAVFHVYRVLRAIVTVLYNSTYFCQIGQILLRLTQFFLYTHPLVVTVLFSTSRRSSFSISPVTRSFYICLPDPGLFCLGPHPPGLGRLSQLAELSSFFKNMNIHKYIYEIALFR